MKQKFAILFGLLTLSAFAQQYFIDWSKVAGGGGQSCGGSFSLIGMIGQHDAGELRGGDFTLAGGFLSGIVLIQTTGAPRISIQLSNGNAMIQWRSDLSAGFVLEQTTDLNNPVSWIPSIADILDDGQLKSATVSASGGLRFFRLRQAE